MTLAQQIDPDVWEDDEGRQIFSTPEALVEYEESGGMVDHRMLWHAIQDLERHAPDQAIAMQDEGDVPWIGFVFDDPEEILHFRRLGGYVHRQIVEVACDHMARGKPWPERPYQVYGKERIRQWEKAFKGRP